MKNPFTSRSSTLDDKAASRSSTLSSLDSEEKYLNNPDNPDISKLFTDAAQWEKALVNTGCLKKCWRSNRKNDSVEGFNDLIGGDLDSSEKAVIDRLAKLSVAGDVWPPPKDEEGEAVGSPLPTPTEQADSDSSDSEVDSDTAVSSDNTIEGEKWKLTPEVVMTLLIQEFGPLSVDGEEEKLILETDGSLFIDVLILGVIHLTTHRLAFHASLLSSRPDLLPSRKVIKSGPVLIHRSGLYSKRRMWMELSHDMLCTYPSSSDEDRIRPLRTVLLSSIKQVEVNPLHPRHLRCVFDGYKDMKGMAEFDTEESALDWKRELDNAIYLYRRARREALSGNGEDSSSGVRLSIPLDRITEFERRKILDFSNVISIRVLLSEGDENNLGRLENPASNSLSMGVAKPCEAWFMIEKYMEAAKARRAAAPNPPSSIVIVDFGPLSYSDADDTASLKNAEQPEKEQAVRAALALGTEPEIWITRGRIARSISSSGYFALTPHYIGFWSKLLTHTDIRYRLLLSTVKDAKPYDVKLLGVHGVRLEIEGHTDVRFLFKTTELRDEVIVRITALLQTVNLVDSPRPISTPITPPGSVPELSPSPSLNRTATGFFAPLSRTLGAVSSMSVPDPGFQMRLPKPINLPHGILMSIPSKHFVCLTIGSRGDVQPYIALGLGLMKEGHRVTIATHDEYKEWITGFGIEHRQAGGDPGALMKLSVENKMFSPEFFKESLQNFRPWLDQLLLDAWDACQGADVLLESPSAMAGVHIAEALNIPYFRTFTMPWTKTTQFPHAFLSPPVESPTFNAASYVLFDNIYWIATSGQINRWRRNTLNIGSTDMGHLAQSKIPFIYNFSPAVVPKPLDWGDTTIISGYWFLDNPDHGWTPPASLTEWMDKARNDGKPIVYIGFGSITVPHPNRVTDHIVKAVLKSDVRAIISKGWSARMSKGTEPEVEIPPECYQLDKVPHDWLFPKIDVAMHHGGAGTTGASLRAGIPTLIKPWFGDQYFWGTRVQKLGAGLRVPSLKVNDIAEALTKATTSRLMKEKAANIGERIRADDGVHTAIHSLYTYLDRAGQDRKKST